MTTYTEKFESVEIGSAQQLYSLDDAQKATKANIKRFFQEQVPSFVESISVHKRNIMAIEDANKALFDCHPTINELPKILAEYRFPGLPPLPPVIGKNLTTGLGKTHTSLQELLHYIKQSVENDVPVYFFVPNHKLGEEHLATFNNLAHQHNITAGTIRGYNQPDEAAPGSKMCLRAPIIESLLQQGVPLKAFCGDKSNLCDHYPDAEELGIKSPCAYRTQFENEYLPELLIMPHQYLFRSPKALPPPSLIIIDESFWQAGLEGFNKLHPIAVPLSHLSEYELGNSLIQAVKASKAGWPTRGQLMARGITPKACDKFLKEQEKSNLEIDFTQISKSEAVKLAQTLQHQSNHHILNLVRDIKNYTQSGKNKLPLIEIDNPPHYAHKQESHLYIYREKPLDPKLKRIPALLLDATMSKALVSQYFPQIETTNLNVEMPHVTIRQITDKNLSARMMIPTEHCTPRKNKERVHNIQRLYNYLICGAKRLEGKETNIDGKPVVILIICQQKLEQKLIKLGFPKTIKTAHFNAIKGLNAYSDIPKLVIAGRILPPVEVVEKYASVMKGGPVTPAGKNKGLYPLTAKSIITTNGETIDILTPCHPDKLAEEIRWQICEAELIQAIGRGRGIRRTADNPLEIDIITNVPLPFPVNTLTTWEEIIPDKLDLCLTMGGVLPLTKGELYRIYPQYFKNIDQARNLLRKEGGTDGIINRFWGGKTPYSILQGKLFPRNTFPWIIEYKRPGKGHGPNWLTVLVHPRHRNPRAILEQRSGPLAAFKLLPKEIKIEYWESIITGETKAPKGTLMVGYTETGRVYARISMNKPTTTAITA